MIRVLVRGIRARRRGRDWSQWTPLIVMLLPPVAAALVLLGVHHRGWTANEVAVAIGVPAAVGALSVGAGTFWQARSYRRRDEMAALVPNRLSRDRLEEWRRMLRSAVLGTRIERGGQLDQMLGYGEDFDPTATIINPGDWRPAVQVGGQVLEWSQIVAQWDSSQGRMVILGEPGYGKTVAALALSRTSTATIGHTRASPSCSP